MTIIGVWMTTLMLVWGPDNGQCFLSQIRIVLHRTYIPLNEGKRIRECADLLRINCEVPIMDPMNRTRGNYLDEMKKMETEAKHNTQTYYYRSFVTIVLKNGNPSKLLRLIEYTTTVCNNLKSHIRPPPLTRFALGAHTMAKSMLILAVNKSCFSVPFGSIS